MAKSQSKKTGSKLRTDYSDKEIWLYKKGSRGEVVGIYQSIQDIVDTERIFNIEFSESNVYGPLLGHWKYFTSLNHQCKVKPVLKLKR